MYIKIGDIILNREEIAHIELNAKAKMHGGGFKDGIRITMTSQDYDDKTGCLISDRFFFEDEEAEAIRWYFNQEGSRDFVDVQRLFDAEQKR